MAHDNSLPPEHDDTRLPEPENKLVPNPAVSHRISGDTVNRATADLPDEQRSTIRRWHAHYIENEMNLEDAGAMVGVGGATVSLIFRGKYPAGIDKLVKQVKAFFDLQDRRAEGRKLKFIETGLTKRIWGVCAAALEFQKIALIFGDQQIGKSFGLTAFRDAHNHGSTIYTCMPTGGSLSNFLVELAGALRIGESLSTTRLRKRIKKAFDDRMILIVDEVHRALPHSNRSARGVDSIEFAREIFDETGCGLVLCATNVFRDAMQAGPVEKILRQTKRRRLCTLQLPNVPSRADLNLFAQAYALPPSNGTARELEQKMVEEEALGMWLTLLRMGAKIAAQKKTAMKWDHVIAAHAGLMDLEKS